MTLRTRHLTRTVNLLLVAAAVLLGGCLDRRLKPLNPCLVSGVVATVSVANIDKVDLLFMVDNSMSMREEQAALREQFPKLIRVLTSGDRDNNGTKDFSAAQDLQLGVVSSDLGLLNVPNAPSLGCRKPFGDDGLLLHSALDPMVPGCRTDPSNPYPAFLHYRADLSTPQQIATDFGCIASLGIDGCGFEQQLEATLKALWPSKDSKGAPNVSPMFGPFLIDKATGIGSQGHGDVENAGFLRNDPVSGLSLIAIIVVSDEEDCSSSNTEHFIQSADAPDGSPYKTMTNLNLRCKDNPQNLFPVQRYISGFKALRPDAENLVIFAGIVGVPPDLVDQKALANVDLTSPSSRTAFYDGILNDPRMIETVDPQSLQVAGKGNLVPSCNTATGVAYPPRRMVEVAKGFGENAIIQSICQSNFEPALDAIISVIARQLGAVCLPRVLVRNADGKVGCNVVWELPPKSPTLSPGIPTSCGETGWEFLLDPGADRKRSNAKGGAICNVAQLAVMNTGSGKQAVKTTTDGVTYERGWYYDDFSDKLKMECTGSSKQRIAFTDDAAPPNGVTVSLECLNETQTLTNTRTDLKPNTQQPSVGDPCQDRILNMVTVSGDKACEISLNNGKVDNSMFCHPQLNVCVLGCNTSADCPAAWVCDDREETKAASGGKQICVNPTCGDLK